MPTNRKVKCPHCGVFFSRNEEEYVQIKNRYWHKKCYEEFLEKKDKESKSIESLESYICELFEIEHISAKIKKQIKDMITYYNFTYSGILGTLKYWYEIKNNTTEKANQGIGIVPYVYTDAKKYYETIFYAQQSNKDINLDSIAKERLKIIIKSPKVNRNKFKVIDIDSLEGKVKND